MSVSHGIEIIIWIYLMNITGVVVRGQVAGPNAVVAINGQTMLDCRVGLSIGNLGDSNWRYTPDGTRNFSTIATGCNPVTGNNAAYYRTELIGDNICRLTIANVTMLQAGVYTCLDGTTITYLSLVTVIDPAASIVVYSQSEVIEGDQLNISCSINYNGPASPAPSLRPSPYWTTSSEQIFTSTTYHQTTNVVTLMATVTVQKYTVPIFQCRTVFEITGTDIRYNATAPADNFTVGSTKESDVLYPPSAPVVTSRPEVIAINDVPCGISVLTCSNSTGNPTPNYRWFDSAENVILSDNNTLTLSEVNRNYKCEAYNTIRNVAHKAPTTHTVADSKCGSTSTVGLQCCVFPRKETTSVTVKGCDNGTLCDCSQGSSGIILTCNAKTFPNASYMWTDPNGQVSNSPIFDKVTMNGMYRCTAYFSKASSNYTGDVKFTNGTNETTVEKCYSSDTTDPIRTIILACVLGGYGLLNLIATIAFIVYYNKKLNTVNSRKQTFTLRNKMKLNARFPWLQRMLPCMNESEGNARCTFLWVLMFILMSIFAGIIVFPILVAMASCSRENNDSRDDTDIGMSNVYQEDTIDRNAAATKSSTDAHGHVEAPYDEIGTMHPGRKVVLEEPTSSKNKDARKVFYTKVNPNFNTEEGVERYSVSS